MTDQKAYQATPNATLEQLIMDPNIPKSEAEHWARREIERLRALTEWREIESAQAHAWDACEKHYDIDRRFDGDADMNPYRKTRR